MGLFCIVITGFLYVLGTTNRQFIWKMNPDAPDSNVCDKYAPNKCLYFIKNKFSRLIYLMGLFCIVITCILYVLGTKNRQFIWKMNPDAPDSNVCDKCCGPK